jgi:tryptophanyl-tRNA synthetase
MKKRMFSGLQVTGKSHLGNYFGAIKQFVDLQNSGEFEVIAFVANLHSLTTVSNATNLRENTVDLIKDFLACGLDPEKVTLFLQSDVSEHAELAWIFNCVTPMGELFRMTQYKDKSGISQIQEEDYKKLDETKKITTITENKLKKEHFDKLEAAEGKATAGLFTYPVLMAADILLYKAGLVPVGDDQMQHLELTRIIARKFNNKFGKTFPEPKNVMLKPLRVMSLKNPDKKMSKTGDEGIMLSDSPTDIDRKIKKAVTASDGKNKSAGVDNLLFLLRHFGKQEEIAFFEDAVKSNTIKYSELKTTLAKDIAEHFAEFRENKKAILQNKTELAEVLGDGARRAKKVASETLMEVKEKIGLL